MAFTLWSDAQYLGRLSLERFDFAPREISGSFTPEPSAAALLGAVAIGIPCVGAWLRRDARLESGEGIVQPMLLGSRLFSLIADRVEEQARQLPLELRDEGGHPIPTAIIAVQSTEATEEWQPLYTEARVLWEATHPVPADDDADALNLPQEMLAELEAEAAEQEAARTAANAWRGEDYEEEEERTFREYLESIPVPPFVVHVRLIDAASVTEEMLRRGEPTSERW